MYSGVAVKPETFKNVFDAAMCSYFCNPKSMLFQITFLNVSDFCLVYNYWRKNKKKRDLPSDRTSYASESSLKRLLASSKLSGFLSGCHFSASFL